MNAGGWTMMILSCGTVLALVIFCFSRILTAPDSSEMHAPLDIDTHEEME